MHACHARPCGGVLRTVKPVPVPSGARTQAYMARELVMPTERPTTAVDMYSFGILAWCAYSGGMKSVAHTFLHVPALLCVLHTGALSLARLSARQLQ